MFLGSLFFWTCYVFFILPGYIMIIMKRKFSIIWIVFFLFFTLVPQAQVSADIAPPEAPPGSNIAPSAETTQVRMVAEKVTLDLQMIPATSGLVEDRVRMKVTAAFTMRNLGDKEEAMQVRFPMADPYGRGDGTLRNYPEIETVVVRVNQKLTPSETLRVANPFDAAYPPVPWATFPVTFPADEDIQIQVSYTQKPTVYLPYIFFTYILETGAAWKDTIGSADFLVRLPYPASWENVSDGPYPSTTQGAVFSGNEISWHFENLEPEYNQNFLISLISPVYWQALLAAQEAVKSNPENGDAWGNLARAYKMTSYRSKASEVDLLEKSSSSSAPKRTRKPSFILPMSPDGTPDMRSFYGIIFTGRRWLIFLLQPTR